MEGGNEKAGNSGRVRWTEHCGRHRGDEGRVAALEMGKVAEQESQSDESGVNLAVRARRVALGGHTLR